jgi:hypothetical protein
LDRDIWQVEFFASDRRRRAVDVLVEVGNGEYRR